MNDDRPTCKTCVFWESNTLKEWGDCHRNPIANYEYTPENRLPKDYWCGEHPGFKEWFARSIEKCGEEP